MMRVHGIAIPEAAESELKAIVAAVPSEDLQRLAADCPQDYPRMKNAPESVRKQLLYYLESGRDLDERSWDCLRSNSLWMRFVVVLSEQALEFGKDGLADWFGAAVFGVALALDPRPTVQKMARSIFERADAAGNPERGREKLQHDFAPFLGELGSLVSTGKPALDAVRVSDADPSVKADLVALRKELEEVRRKEKQASKQAAHLEERRIVLEKDVQDERERVRDLVAKGKTLRAELDAEKRGREDVVRAAVEHETRALVRTYLTEPAARVAADEEAMATGDVLLDRAQTAVRSQTARERAVGSRHALRAKLEALEVARDEVATTIEDSLKPSADLRAVLVDIETGIAGLRTTLGVAAPVDPVVTRLLTLADATGSWEACARLKTLVADLERRGVVSPASALIVVQKLDHRIAGQLDDAAAQDGKARAGEGEPEDALWRFKRAVDRGEEDVLLLVDGTNLACRPEFMDLMDEGGRAGREARAGVLQRLERLAARGSRLSIQVWFDSETASEETRDRVTIRYSGGRGRDKADRALLAHLDFVQTQQPRPCVFTASDDIDLCRQARTAGAAVIANLELAGLLLDL